MRLGAVHFEDAYEIYIAQMPLLNGATEQSPRVDCADLANRVWRWRIRRDTSQGVYEEMARIKALPAATGMGLAMIGPTILSWAPKSSASATFRK